MIWVTKKWICSTTKLKLWITLIINTLWGISVTDRKTTLNHLGQSQSAISLLKLLRKESFLILLLILGLSPKKYLDTISSNSSQHWMSVISKESPIEIWKLRTVSLMNTTTLKLETSDLLLVSKEVKLMKMVFSKLYSEHQAIWLLKFILNKNTMVIKLMSSLQQSLCSSCMLDIHHLVQLQQKMLTTKL